MPGSALQMYNEASMHLQFQPNAATWKQAFYSMLNQQAVMLYQRAHWKWNNGVYYLYLYADYTTGTMTITQGSQVVTGVGTTWESHMENAWIAPGTDPSDGEFVRIGRVDSTTQINLPAPYARATQTDTSYVIRWRFYPLPRDVLVFDGMTARTNNFGPLSYISAQEAETLFFNTKDTGTPNFFTPGIPNRWALGQNGPTPPANAPTCTAVAGGSLTVNTTYTYKYTYYSNGVESGASGTATATTAGANLTIRLTGLERVGATDGAYARIYRAGPDGLFYKIADHSGSSTYDDDGSDISYSVPYNESGLTQYVRFYPRTTTDDFEIEMRYQAIPRTIQKDSDYLEMPLDAQMVVEYGAVAALARAMNKGGIATQYQGLADRLTDQLQRTETAERPQLMARAPTYSYGRGNRWYPIVTNPATRS